MRYLIAALLLSATIAACGTPEGSYGTGNAPSHTQTASYGTGKAV